MERIFECENKYGGLLVHIDASDGFCCHIKNPACTGEVVRCRDCKHHFADDEEPGMVCRRECLDEWGLKQEIEFQTDPDCFCAWGERRG